MLRKSHLVLIALWISPLATIPSSFGHEGPHGPDDQQHESSDKAVQHPTLMTTRVGGRLLPPAKSDDVFHFVVYGDRTGGVPAGLEVLKQAVHDTNLLDPDLVMTVGDLIQGYNEKPEWMAQMKEYREIMSELNMQWFPVAGNHDVYWRGPGDAPAGHHESNYEEHFGPLWYSFQHKNCGFIALYSDEGDPESNEKGFNSGKLQTMSDQQLAFLEKALNELKGSEHVFVFLHHPRWIGGGYEGGNWDTVHNLLKEAGNVSAVFAGHIHRMRYDGPRDGIEYFTLATTGGHLSADIPGAGYLHHLNIVTVRKSRITVSALPVGSVIDPKDFSTDFLEQVELARRVRPVFEGDRLPIHADGTAEGSFEISVSNPCKQPVDINLIAERGDADSFWRIPDFHTHAMLEAGESKSFTIEAKRLTGSLEELRLPSIRLQVSYRGTGSRVDLPDVVVPISVRPSVVPADYFANQPNHCLQVNDESDAVAIAADQLNLPDGPMTLEAWVKPSSNLGFRAIIAKTESSEFAFFSDEGVPQFDIHLGGKYVSAKAKQKLAVDEWTHLAGVFDGKSVKIFVNGQLISSVEGSGERRSNPLPLFIGADPDRRGRPGRGIRGQIDEVRISKKANYTENFKPVKRFEPSQDDALLMHLDRTFGPFVLDHSPNAVEGKLGTTTELVSSTLAP